MKLFFISFVSVYVILPIAPCFGGQKVTINKNGVVLGGGSDTNKCNFTEIDRNVIHWQPYSFPIQVAISKDLSSQRTKIILHAIKIWNETYNQYLKNYIPEYTLINC